MTDEREFRQFRFRLPEGGTDLLLVRHGESAPVRPDEPVPLSGGQSDPSLDARGVAEADRVAHRLADAGITAIYVSGLRRTLQTALPLALKLGLDPIVDRGLREVHLGDWEGGGFRVNVAQEHPTAQRMWAEQRWDVIPGAETATALTERLRAAVARIHRAHPDERVAVFSHGGVIGTLLHLATGSAPFAFVGSDNAAISHLVVVEDRWIIRRFNDTAHLETDLDRPSQP